jgi:peptidoglycan/LPS O-acetylase OafA/YrhL
MTTQRTEPGAERSDVELNPDFPVLDTLRAVGAIAVLTTHVSFQTGDYVRHGILGALLARLDLGVAVFFILSGFLLTRPYLARAALGRAHPPTGRYYWKRVVRIYPVYVVSVVVALTVIPVNRTGGLPEWLRSLTLTDVFAVGRLPQGLTQMWSLSVEATFYLLLPLLVLALVGRRRLLRPSRVLALLLAGTGVSIWWNASLAGQLDRVVPGTPLLWLPAHLTWFLVGVFLALVHVLGQQRTCPAWAQRVVALGAMPGVCLSAAGGLLLVAATPLGGPTLLLIASPTQSVLKHLLYASIAGLVVMPGVFALPDGRFVKTLSVGWLRHLGHISYSIFCMHLVVLYLARSVTHHELFSGHWLSIWLLTMAGSLVAAELLYRLVEKPALRLRDLGRGTPRSGGHAKSAVHASTTNS